MLPETGASTRTAPTSSTTSVNHFTPVGPVVPMSITTVPRSIDWSAPWSPAYTDLTDDSSASIEITTSAPSAAAAGDAAAVPPCSRDQASAFAAVRL